ncbi:MAG: caspase family protein [Flavobacteriales bacterium]|nr:caspase family protein [Flavobacteriales bacterium]
MKKGLIFALIFTLLKISPVLAIEIIPQVGHATNVTALAFSADGKTLASADANGNIILWDIETRLQKGVLKRHSDAVSVLEFSNDGNYLVSGGTDKMVLLWSIEKSMSIIVSTHSYYINDVHFDPTNQFIVNTSADFSLNIYEIKTGKSQRIYHTTDLTGMCFNDDGSKIYVGSYEGELLSLHFNGVNSDKSFTRLYDVKNLISGLEYDPKNNMLMVANAASWSSDEEAPEEGDLRFFDLKSGKLSSENFPFSTSYSYQNGSLKYVEANSYLAISNTGKLYRFTQKNKSETFYDQLENVSEIAVNSSTQKVAVASKRAIKMFALDNPYFVQEFVGMADGIERVINANAQNITVQYENSICQWSLTTGRKKVIRDVIGIPYPKAMVYTSDGESSLEIDARWNFAYWKSDDHLNELVVAEGNPVAVAKISDDDKYLALVTEGGTFYVYSLDSLKEVVNYQVSDESGFFNSNASICFSNNSQKVAVAVRYALVFDLVTGKNEVALQYSRAGNHGYLGLSFSDDDRYLYVSDHSITQVSTLPKNSDDFDKITIPPGLFSEDTAYLISRPGLMGIIELERGVEISSKEFPRNEQGIFADVSCYYFPKGIAYFYVGMTDGNILRINKSTWEVASIKIGASPILCIQPIEEKNMLLVANEEEIALYDEKSWAKQVGLYSLRTGGYVATSADGYYLRSKNGLNAVAIKKDGKMFFAEQFDLKLNRPDLVLKKMKTTDAKLINLYYEAFSKRVGLNEAINEFENIPQTKILNKDKLKQTTKKPYTKLLIEAQSSSGIATIQAWVNGTAVVFGANGMSVANNPKTHSTTLNIPLKTGRNRIEVASQNVDGVWSAKEVVEVVCNPSNTEKKMLIIAVSVSNYLDTTQRLQYAVKDGQDFTEIWKKNGRKTLGYPSQYKEVEVIQLFDENATREHILALKEKINQLSANDMVMLYVSGHGLLDEQQQFWYATHNMDFEHPEKYGVSYNELESLLDKIPTQNKVMFLDACHSGLVDNKITTDTLRVENDYEAKVIGYSAKGAKTKALKVTSNQAYEQMQELFNNLSRGSGTIVISAAAGNSYAYESEEWGNGVFTYCLVSGIRDRKADADKDGEISITELSNYISEEVEKLTNGAQKPNERQENLFNNFRIW